MGPASASFASQVNRACVIEPPAELAAVEAAREQKLYASLLDYHADVALGEAVPAARAAGPGANRLAELVAPAISRPVALKLAKRYPDYLSVGHQVSVPEYSVPEGWARKGEIVSVDEQAAVVELNDGHRQELPLDELTPA
ncbi:hypothetical protein OG978_45810 (plasmid) [Streptomyces sp. NBC_01591]|uniref:hypothetical protein n=1 Tax=Streptomyces sp. NBC_01591 TaxID=2975888 RepID=UPI002DD99AEA|nr:hypothetical protein [Streptomyces sp. NBC_01591]WSD74374.1 hypothetical protein OG978_45810 [Streptomyces sp. NBC_01591]